MKKVSIRDIAQKAGVANSTVTNALNPNSKKISQEKRELILQLVEEMNYQPMKSAQSLSAKNKKVIGLFLRSSNHFSSGVVDQKLIYYFNKFANDLNIELITIITSYDQEKSYEEIQSKIHSYNFTHIVIQGLDRDLDMLNKILALPPQKILIELPITNKNTVFISTNNFSAQENLTFKICRENKIENILYITGNLDAYVSIERLKGFESACTKLNVNYNIIQSGFEKAEIIASISNIDFVKYDLIACASDTMVGLVAKQCQEQNIKKIIISGFDGDGFLEYLNYKIYTINQNIEQLCKDSINMIINDDFESKLLDYKIDIYNN